MYVMAYAAFNFVDRNAELRIGKVSFGSFVPEPLLLLTCCWSIRFLLKQRDTEKYYRYRLRLLR